MKTELNEAEISIDIATRQAVPVADVAIEMMGRAFRATTPRGTFFYTTASNGAAVELILETFVRNGSDHIREQYGSEWSR